MRKYNSGSDLLRGGELPTYRAGVTFTPSLDGYLAYNLKCVYTYTYTH